MLITFLHDTHPGVIAAAYVVEGLLGYLVVGCGVVFAFRVISHEFDSSLVVWELPYVHVNFTRNWRG